MKKLYCEHCGVLINPDTDVYFESELGIIYCEERANECLIWSDDIYAYVHMDQYKEFYLDDELSDVELFTKHEPEGDVPTILSLKDKAEHLIKILVDNMIDDVEVVAEAIWDLFIPEPFPSLEKATDNIKRKKEE
jgi:hypothetical protein